MRKWSIAALFSFMVSLSAVAQATYCPGPVSVTRMEGAFYYADFGYGLKKICNIDVAYNVTAGPYGSLNIQPTACEGLVAAFETAKSTKRSMSSFFWGSSPCPTGADIAANYPTTWIFNGY